MDVRGNELVADSVQLHARLQEAFAHAQQARGIHGQKVGRCVLTPPRADGTRANVRGGVRTPQPHLATEFQRFETVVDPKTWPAQGDEAWTG